MPHAQLKLRITDDLRAKAEAAAKANQTSLNAELISRLESTFSQDLRLVRGEREARVIIHGGKLLVLDLPTSSSPMVPAELDVDAEVLADLLDHFGMQDEK